MIQEDEDDEQLNPTVKGEMDGDFELLDPESEIQTGGATYEQTPTNQTSGKKKRTGIFSSMANFVANATKNRSKKKDQH